MIYYRAYSRLIVVMLFSFFYYESCEEGLLWLDPSVSSISE